MAFKYSKQIQCTHCKEYFYMDPRRKYCDQCHFVKTTCTCGKEIEVRRDQYIENKQYFCSKKCFNSTYQRYCEKCNKVTNWLHNMCFTCHNSSDVMRKSSSKIGKETIKYAIDAHEKHTGIKYCEKCNQETKHIMGIGCMTCHNKRDEMRQILSELRKEEWKNPEYAYKISQNLGDYLGNKEWGKEVSKIGREKLAQFLDENPNLRYQIIQKTIKSKINNIQEDLNKINFTISKSCIDIYNLQELKSKDICGAYSIKAKYKNDIGTKNENIKYDIMVCKSLKIYNEIYWALRVLSKPEKQQKEISEDNSWTTAKWWYIANLYYDFEFELLTDPNGVSEEEAVLAEVKYAIDNDLFVEFIDYENRIPKIEKHAYFSL